MASLSRSEFNSFIQSTLPDNSSREISALDLRTSFFNLADSIELFNNNIDISSKNFGELDTRSLYAGSNTFVRKSTNTFFSEDNSGFGYASLELTLNSRRNTALGSYSLSCNAIGNDNIGVGFQSVGGLTVGSGNIGVGNYSLLKNKTGDFNIAIGHGAGFLSGRDDRFKFYLGVYPDASGDCDTSFSSINKSPLLYGDLNSLQLAIGASGFRGGEKLSVSGDIIPFESGRGFSLGSGEYRWNASIEDLYVSGNIQSQQPFYNVYFSDGDSNPDLIDNYETVFISGISGIKTEYKSNSNLMQVSAQPISGWADSTMKNYAHESGVLVSGWAYNELNLISGWSPGYLVYDVSGSLENYINISSGSLDSYIEDVSGWSFHELNLISGWSPGYLVYDVSGWNKSYTDQEILSLSLASDAYLYWRISDGTTIRNIGTLEETQFLGVSGLETQTKTSGPSGIVISARPLDIRVSGLISTTSGILKDTIDASGSLITSNYEDEISTTSGVLVEIIKDYAYESGVLVSGWAYHELNSISGWEPGRLVYDVSGASVYFSTKNFNTLDGRITNTGVLVSGWARETIKDYAYESGVLVSGWAYNELNLISGWQPGYLVYNVSGYLEDYADSLLIAANAYTHWTISDSINNKNIGPTQTLNIVGISGSESNFRSDNNTLEISSRPISGYFDFKINEITKVDGIIDNRLNDYLLTETFNDFVDDLFSTAGLSGTLYNSITNGDFLLSGWARETIKDYAYDSGVLVSGWAYNELNLISGWKPGYLVYDVSGSLISYIEDVKDFNKNYTDTEIQDLLNNINDDAYLYWKIIDQNNNSVNIFGQHFVKINGSKGISTETFTDGNSSHGITISADGISGWARETIKDYAYDSGVLVSGWSNYQSNLISGWKPGYLVYDVSGAIIHDIFQPEGYVGLVSGWSRQTTENYIYDSGVLTSGWAHHQLNLISGWKPGYLVYDVSGVFNYDIFDAQGYVGLVSGYLEDWANNTFSVIVPGGSYTHWTISDQDNTQESINQGHSPVIFEGSSGIQTFWRSSLSTLEISAQPLSGWTSYERNLISGWKPGYLVYDVSGWVDSTINSRIQSERNSINQDPNLNGAKDRQELYSSGVAISGWARETIKGYAYNSGVLVSGWAYHELNLISGWKPGYLVYDISGYLDTSNTELDQRASGLISQVSGILTTSAGSGLVKLSNGEFNTAGSGNFERVILNINGKHPSGQVVADSGYQGITQYHDIVNSSGYLVVPFYDQFEHLKTLNSIDPENSGAIAFAGGYIRVADGNKWNRPTIIEGFLQEDILEPTDYSNPTSGKIITRNENFQASDIYYVTNRDHTFAASGGYFVIANLINNEYRPIWSTCSGCAAE